MGTESFVKVLKQCESAGGAGSKQEIKNALAELDHDGQTLFKYAMDPMLVFGVKKFDMPTKFAEHDVSILPFTNLLDALDKRELTGNAAKSAITETLGRYTVGTAKYLARVLYKDLAAGFSDETYNKVHPKNPVTIFSVMLADKCATEEEFEAINFPVIADVKYDGERNICIVKSNSVTYHSRNGKIAEHMTGLFDEDLLKLRKHLGYDFVLDGERMARDFTETMNAKKGGKDGDAARANMIFRAFFLMPLVDWVKQRTTIAMGKNRAFLIDLLEKVDCKKIVISDAKIVNDYAEMMAELERVTTAGFDGQPKGHEGLILKDMASTYLWDRSMAWCKVKKFYSADLRVLNWEYGAPRGRHANRMGRVNCGGWLEDGTYVECGVGSGWSDPEREDAASYVGKTIEVWYQEVSKSKNKQHASLRFTSVKKGRIFRDDKNVKALDEDAPLELKGRPSPKS